MSDVIPISRAKSLREQDYQRGFLAGVEAAAKRIEYQAINPLTPVERRRAGVAIASDLRRHLARIWQEANR